MSEPINAEYVALVACTLSNSVVLLLSCMIFKLGLSLTNDVTLPNVIALTLLAPEAPANGSPVIDTVPVGELAVATDSVILI